MMVLPADADLHDVVPTESRGTMRRTVARIGIVAALALSVGVVTAQTPPARADEPAAGLVSATRANDDEMNYAINLAPGASASDLERAIGLVPSVKGVALASYPEIGTFFAQSATPSFAPDLAAALKGRRHPGSTPSARPAPRESSITSEHPPHG